MIFIIFLLDVIEDGFFCFCFLILDLGRIIVIGIWIYMSGIIEVGRGKVWVVV